MKRRKVWKFVLGQDNAKDILVSMPCRAEVLSVGYQFNARSQVEIVLWALVNPSATTGECRTFQIIATGLDVVDEEKMRKFIGTVTTPSREVWHVFEML